MSARTTLILLLFCASSMLGAAPPSSLSYQGNLANAGGQPITASLGITFRLYAVASGGSALWTETQAAVPIDGGNLSVELGSLTALPTSIWGKQLYLGIQIAGDSEMLPRPKLTAAPYALRAASTMKNTFVVSGEGTASENGSALLATFAALPVATAANPLTVEVDSGIFDLGNLRLNMPQFVTLVGRGRDATEITSTHEFGTLRINSNTEVRHLKATNNGVPSSNTAFPPPFGIGGFVDPNPDVGPITNVRLTDVTGKSVAANGTNNSRQGIYLCASQSFITNVDAFAYGGNFSIGFRADCPSTEGEMFIDGLKISAGDSSLGVRGAYLAGGGPWKDIQAFIETSPTADTVFGIRVFTNTRTASSALINPIVVIHSPLDYQTSTSVGGPTVDGLRIERAEVSVLGGFINIDRVSGRYFRGINKISIPGDLQQGIEQTRVDLDVLAQPNYADGAATGVVLQSSGGDLNDLKVRVVCKPGTNSRCAGIGRQPAVIANVPQAMQGLLKIDGSDIYVTQQNPGPNGYATGVDVNQGETAIVRSTVRIYENVVNTGAPTTAAVSVNNTTTLRVFNSTLLADGDSAAVPNGGCVGKTISASSALSLTGTTVSGSVCGTAACVGTSKFGASFLASTCP